MATPPQPVHGTQLVMLGTGSPYPDPDRSGPALAVMVNGTPYLVDCGPGVVRRMVEAQRRGVAGASPMAVHTALSRTCTPITPWVIRT